MTRFAFTLFGIAAIYSQGAFAQSQPPVTPWVGTGNSTSGALLVAPVGSGCTGCVPLPTSATIVPSGTQNVNVTQFGTSAVVTGTGAGGAGIPRVTVSSDSALTATIAAGANIIGKVGIDQTTPGVTNGVNIAPTSAAGVGITSTVTGSAAASLVLKNTAGNLYSVYATNLTASSGFLTVLNLTSPPADGAIAPVECILLPANGTAAITFDAGPPEVYSTGIVASITSATTCFTKTTGVITAFIHGAVK